MSFRAHNLITSTFVPVTPSQQYEKANSMYRDRRDAGDLPEQGWHSDTDPYYEQRYLLESQTRFWENEELYALK